MPDAKLTALTALATPAVDDYIYIVDTSDTTDDPAGSSRKTLLSNLLKELGLSQSLADFISDVGNSGTDETDLYSFTIPANMLTQNGDRISAYYSLSITGSATATSQIKVYFSGTARFDSGALSLSSSGNWQCWVEMVRTGASTGRISVVLQTPGASLAAYTAEVDMTSQDFTATNVIKITGTRAGVGAASNDILAKHGYVEKSNAA